MSQQPQVKPMPLDQIIAGLNGAVAWIAATTNPANLGIAQATVQAIQAAQGRLTASSVIRPHGDLNNVQ